LLFFYLLFPIERSFGAQGRQKKNRYSADHVKK